MNLIITVNISRKLRRQDFEDVVYSRRHYLLLFSLSLCTNYSIEISLFLCLSLARPRIPWSHVRNCGVLFALFVNGELYSRYDLQTLGLVITSRTDRLISLITLRGRIP